MEKESQGGQSEKEKEKTTNIHNEEGCRLNR